MSELDKLKDDAERYAEDHPEKVREAERGVERAVEDELGLDRGQAQDNPRDPGRQQDLASEQRPGGDGGQDRGQQDQGQ
jgi:hypothetical protein